MKASKSPKHSTEKEDGMPVEDAARLGRDIQAKIGEQLRAMYGGVVEQGVPDRFVELLSQIDGTGKDKKAE